MLELNLTGHIAVVTGGSGNLGRVICRTLAQCGADICVHYNGSKDKAEKVAQEIRAMGRRAMVAQADVGDLASVLKMRDAVEAELGQADIIVNNAVAQYKWTSVLEQDDNTAPACCTTSTWPRRSYRRCGKSAGGASLPSTPSAPCRISPARGRISPASAGRTACCGRWRWRSARTT